jgi:hypothetical protein
MSLIYNQLRQFSLSQGGSLCGTLSKIIDTPVNGRPSLFRIDSVHRDFSFPLFVGLLMDGMQSDGDSLTTCHVCTILKA